MSIRPIGYYVHHRGAGHWARARAIAPLLDRPCTLIGTFDAADRAPPGESRLDLPDDAIGSLEGADGEADRPEGLHYAPLGSVAIRRRMARIAAWVEAQDPVMMIVDVSVEISLFARLLSVPTVVIRLAGQRTDRPHLEAFRGAERLLAPFPAALDDPSLPSWVRDKTIYAGLLAPSRSGAPRSAVPENGGAIVVVFGRGGEGGGMAGLAEAARAVPDRPWHVLGPVRGERGSGPPNLHLHGWVDDISPYVSDAALVIGTGGDGVVAAVATEGKRFICIPEARPFDEQRAKAVALHRLGAALHLEGWLPASDWPRLISSALSLDPRRLAALANPEAPARTARLLGQVATDLDRRAGRTSRPDG